MITPQQFIDKYLGEPPLDYDKVFGDQCVDPIKAWHDYVNGLGHCGPLGGSGGAIEIIKNFPNGPFKAKDYDIVLYTGNLNQYPVMGDYVVYAPIGTNKAGHTGIAVKVYPGQNKLDILEQNGGTGSGKGVGTDHIRIYTRPYTASGGVGAVVGWLHFKRNNTLTQQDMQDIEQLKKDVATLKTNDETLFKYNLDRMGNLQNDEGIDNQKFIDMNTRLNDLSNQINDELTKLQNAPSLEQINKSITDMLTSFKETLPDSEAYQKQVKQAYADVESMKQPINDRQDQQDQKIETIEKITNEILATLKKINVSVPTAPKVDTGTNLFIDLFNKIFGGKR